MRRPTEGESVDILILRFSSAPGMRIPVGNAQQQLSLLVLRHGRQRLERGISGDASTALAAGRFCRRLYKIRIDQKELRSSFERIGQWPDITGSGSIASSSIPSPSMAESQGR